MTVEQLITRYVYQHGEISLQGIGTIKLMDAVPDAEYLQKHRLVVINGLEFVHQKSAVTTPDFVKYYATQRGKIASLAVNDIEAYLSMAIQFLNIGNPFEIKGLGTLSKINDGTLLMAPGFFVITKEEEATGKLKERQADVDEKTGANFYGEKEQQSGPMLKIGLAALAVIIVVAGGWWLFSTFFKNTTASEQSTTTETSDTVVVPQSTNSIDSPSTTASNQLATVNDSLTVVSWKAYFRKANGKDTAIALLTTLNNKLATEVYMDTKDSVSYQYFVQLQSAAKDTAYKRDSIRKFFQRPIRLEKMQ